MKHILVNSCHGNAPAIIGTSIAQEIAANYRAVGETVQIVVPHIYGREKRILLEEGLFTPDVVLDDEVGRLHRQVLFEGDFNAQMRKLIAHRDGVEQQFRSYLKQTYPRFDLELNIGSFFTGEAPAVLAYPCAYTELYERTLRTPDLEKKYDRSLLEQLLEKMHNVDSCMMVEYIPTYNPFSFDDERKHRTKEVETPPLRKIPSQVFLRMPKRVVYCMLPGTGVERDVILQRARMDRELGFTIYVPPWVTDTEFKKRKPLKTIPHQNVQLVLSRAGWGTIYLCQVTGKELMHVDFTADEPEVYFNVKTLNRKDMREATRKQLHTFGTVDGISFVAQDIMKRFLSR